ncbi:SLATT domain-containing protein [Pedobacter paludis]|uniref:SMODS and SLOG-associating 2TM effector domain-containing protein n=1 Tax=Pedobacter paludis TaxID=2203212 RepID=A0A317F2A7_9SPHI|nr:SLATT domain-containing protein [Pedobacter paludis]PWS33304.1 hypothetical protein DF947_01375 [Pedobacter paludis]
MINESQRRLVVEWTKKVHILEYAHRFESKRQERKNIYYGVPPIIIGALITIQVVNNFSIPFASIGGCIIAILTGLQTFLKPTELAEKHRRISETYEKLRNRFEYLLIYEINEASFNEKLNRIKSDWDNLETLNVPVKIYLEAKSQVKKNETYPEPPSFIINSKTILDNPQ